MIDLHTHILPGVDDGVKTLEEAVAFARMAWEDGTRTLVATPHCREGFFYIERDQVLEAVAKLRRSLAEAEVPLEVLPGAEVHLAPELVQRVRDGRAPTLADNGRTLLLELSLSQYPVGLEDVIFQLKLAGIVPVLAHPERIRFFQDDVRRYEEVVRLGAYGQITSGSLLGSFGEETEEFSEMLVRRGLVHVIASDAHNTRGRAPKLSRARDLVASWLGEEAARRMVEAVPAALLKGEAVEVPEPEAATRRRRGFLSRWFGGE